jgi:hypothetical protein
MNIRDDAPASLQGRELQEAASGTEFEKLTKSLLLVAYSYLIRQHFTNMAIFEFLVLSYALRHTTFYDGTGTISSVFTITIRQKVRPQKSL